ncbi:MAG TPA: type II toxin-antitoxin system RelE/ParE family toxin [Candidatus Angelobacter sp.]|nr:type II toxin-antitoxin system RelE/ParE family toxin [Candidatus Angelobacter sp.]
MKIRWTAVAANDLKATYEYISEDSITHANTLIERILSSIEMLERYPNLGREGRLEGTRELVITGTPFLVFYRIRRNQVEILGVLHAARKWPDSV